MSVKYYAEYELTGNTILNVENVLNLNKTFNSLGIGTAAVSDKLLKVSGDTYSEQYFMRTPDVGTSLDVLVYEGGKIKKSTTTLPAIGSDNELIWRDTSATYGYNATPLINWAKALELLNVGAYSGATVDSKNQSYFSTNQMALSQLEGGAYFGRVGLTENQFNLTNCGLNWAESNTPQLNWVSVAMSSDGRIQTACDDTGYVFVSFDYGQNWNTGDVTPMQISCNAMSSDGRIQSYCATSNVLYMSVEYIYYSYDYGQLWSVSDTSVNDWTSIAMSSDGKIQSACANNEYIWYSHSYGKTWLQSDSPSLPWSSIAMSSDGKIQYACSLGNRVYFSYNYGVNWGRFSLPSLNWTSIATSSDGSIISICINNVSGGQIYTSNNFGISWTIYSNDLDWTDIAMSSDGKIQSACANNEYIYYSYDYGINWVVSNSPLLAWSSIAMSSDGKIQSASVISNDYVHISYATSNTMGNVVINGKLDVTTVDYGTTTDYLIIDGNTVKKRSDTAILDAKSYTGFVDGSNILITYDWTGRTITISGNTDYYWKGVKYRTPGSPWTSTGHTATVGGWYLYSSDGINFIWSQVPWSFTDIMVAFVNYKSTLVTTFAIRETHGLMDWFSHQEFHQQIGTYLVSGGKLTAGTYLENSPNDANNSPGFDAAVIKDEDCSSSINVWTEGVYTRMYVSGLTSISTTGNTLPFQATVGTYIQVNNVSTGTMTAGINNRYYNVYQILIPTTNDTGSARFRMVMLQPQSTYTSLASAIAEDTRALGFGELSTLSAEFVIYARITYVTATGDSNNGKCRIATGGITYVIGNRLSQITVSNVSSSNHASLSNLTWLTSAHIGNNNKVAGFDGTGTAVEYGVPNITNPADNRILTSLGTTETANAEANLTFDGSKLTITGSGGTVLEVLGYNGQLFSIIDSSSGDIFIVDNSTGVPILTIDDTKVVTIDGYLKINSFLYTGMTAGTSIISIFPMSYGSGAFFDYYVKSTTNMRAGTIMCIWDGSIGIEYTDISTNDLGNTTPISLYADINGANVRLNAIITSGTWIIKTGIRLI